MNWQLLAQHAWQPPLAFAARVAGESDFSLLYSGRQEAASGANSFLALEPAFHATGTHWEDLPPVADTSALPDWIGYLGYGTGSAKVLAPSPVPMPDFWLTRYQRLYYFDHATETILEYGRYDANRPRVWDAAPAPASLPTVQTLRSNMTRARYEESVRDTVHAIAAGDFYQANITRKFSGTLTAHAEPMALFARLCARSPAPFSALIRHGDMAILSSSPESFLQVDAQTITARPIKGSIRRGADAGEDMRLREQLRSSEKNQAENLMIVDLMRHDLAQVSKPGSVRVREQSALYSYATIHHLVSTIDAQRAASVSVIDIVRACFPPGSMTGAPKHAVMQWCAAQERIARGVYSGAIGWLNAARCDLSVVIRTVLLAGDRFEFQVGGGIVADSDPADEWHETLVKARGIAQAMGIDEATLAAL